MHYQRICWVGILLLNCPIHGLNAATTPVLVAPQAADVLKQMAAFLGPTRSFRADLAVNMTMQAMGATQQVPMQYVLSVQRPNQFSLQLTNGVMGANVWCDGKNLYTYVPFLRQYTVARAPRDLSGLSEAGGVKLPGKNSSKGSLLGALFGEHADRDLLRGVRTGQYAGIENIDAKPCHHLKFYQEDMNWEIWVQQGNQPLIRKTTADLSKLFRQQITGDDSSGPDLRMSMSIQFNRWLLNPQFAPGQFKFTPPPGAQKVDSFGPGE